MEESSPEHRNNASEEKQEEPVQPVDEKIEKQEEVDSHEHVIAITSLFCPQMMAKLLEEYLTLVEEDDQDRDKDQLIQLTLDTKGHLMDDEGKVKAMEHIVDGKLRYREELITKFSDLKYRFETEEGKVAFISN